MKCRFIPRRRVVGRTVHMDLHICQHRCTSWLPHATPRVHGTIRVPVIRKTTGLLQMCWDLVCGVAVSLPGGFSMIHTDCAKKAWLVVERQRLRQAQLAVLKDKKKRTESSPCLSFSIHFSLSKTQRSWPALRHQEEWGDNRMDTGKHPQKLVKESSVGSDLENQLL